MNNLEKLEQALMDEIDYYKNNNITTQEKKERFGITDRINKSANNVIAIYAVIQRSRSVSNDARENKRLTKRFNTED